MRLFLTGATGYLGSEIRRRAALDLPERVEILDADAVHRAVAGHDAVIHTAYRQDDARVTVEGSANVARAAAAHGARLVHLSSDVVFGGDKGSPYVEMDRTDPVTAYGESKAEAERMVTAACPGAVLVRTSLIYGGPEPSRHEQLAHDEDATFYDDEIRCPIAVADLAAAVLELAALPTVSGPLHVAGAEPVSRLEFARLVTGRDDLRGAPRPPGRPGDLTLDCTRARGLLRTPLRGVREVLGGVSRRAC